MATRSATTAAGPVARTCPRCGLSDQVHFVPDLVARLPTQRTGRAAPINWQGTTYYVPLGDNLSAPLRLAVRLFPPASLRTPPQPEPEPFARVVRRSEIIRTAVILIGGAAFLYMLVPSFWLPFWFVLLLMFLVAQSRQMRANTWAAAWRANQRPRAPQMSTLGIMGDVRLEGAMRALDPGHPRYKQALRKATEKQARAISHWQSACYCGRDDVVFLPGQATCCRPEMIETLLSG